jgi:putative FmdB family regulatory protein
VPIYDYACSACGHVVEVIHGINDPGPHFCPNCGVEGSMRKRIVTSAVHFKGSGWAKKDRSTASSSHKAKTAASASSTSSETTTAGDAAPAKAKEPAATKSAEGD